MKYTARELEDGAWELVTVLTEAELDAIRAEASAADASAEPMFLGISFKRKTDYCVTCLNGQRQTIWAYGDLHAFAMALAACGAGFSMSKGACR